jgi:hypothetical protein
MGVVLSYKLVLLPLHEDGHELRVFKDWEGGNRESAALQYTKYRPINNNSTTTGCGTHSAYYPMSIGCPFPGA